MTITFQIAASPLSGTVAVGVTLTGKNATKVTQVEFWVNGVKKATDTSSPYSYSWNTTLAPDGDYTLMAKAFYPRNGVETNSITRSVLNFVAPPPPPPPLPGPVVSSNIVSGQTVEVGTAWQVTVTPTPTSVEFWADGALLVNDQMAPFGTTISLAEGTHSLGLCATVGGVRTCFGSNGVFAAGVVVVAAPAPPPPPPTDPTLTSSIADGATVARGTVWTVTTNPDASLVEFWADGAQIGTDTTEPYTTTINLAAGSHQIGVCATVAGVRTCFGTGGVLATITVTDVAPPPPPPSFDIPAYRFTEPQGGGNHGYWTVQDSTRRQIVGDGVQGDKHAIIMWSTDGGGTGPLYSGKVMYSIHGFRLITGKPYRTFDWHTQPNDQPWGWAPPGSGGGVAALAIDYPSAVGSMQSLCICTQAEQDAGRPWEHEILSVAEIETMRGQWVWLWVETLLGRPGRVRVWVNGVLRLDKQGVNTHYYEQHQFTFWNGLYSSVGFATATTYEVAATRFGRTPQECYEDRPALYTSWAGSGTGGTLTTISSRSSTEAAIPSELRW